MEASWPSYEAFEQYFVKRRSVVFERAKFNTRVQKEAESVDDFITDVFRLAEHCEFSVAQRDGERPYRSGNKGQSEDAAGPKTYLGKGRGKGSEYGSTKRDGEAATSCGARRSHSS